MTRLKEKGNEKLTAEKAETELIGLVVKVLKSEKISKAETDWHLENNRRCDKDKMNGGYIAGVDLYLIIKNRFIKAELNTKDGIKYLIEHVISKDVKGTRISSNSCLHVYFNGFESPERIWLKNYDEARRLQKNINEIRDRNKA